MQNRNFEESATGDMPDLKVLKAQVVKWDQIPGVTAWSENPQGHKEEQVVPQCDSFQALEQRS